MGVDLKRAEVIRRGLAPDRAFDSCFEGGVAWNRHVTAHVYFAALDDDALMRQLPRYLDMETVLLQLDFELLECAGV